MCFNLNLRTSVTSSVTVLKGHTDGLGSAVFSPSGDAVLTASWDGTARLWDARTGELKAVLEGHTDRVVSAAFDRSGNAVVTASLDKTARLWDARTGELKAVLEGHTDALHSAAFNRSGDAVVTAGWDRTARIWDATTGEPKAVLEGHHGPVYSAVFNRSGDAVLTASRDGTARIWNLWNLTVEEETCVICHESMTKTLPCGHTFHAACIATWLKRSATCPTCREPVCVRVKDIGTSGEDAGAAPLPPSAG